MKHPERAADYLEHIIDASQAAMSYIDGITDLASFEMDQRTLDAVIRNIEIIGEAATRLCKVAEELVSEHPEVPWIEMRTMRNKLIHNYFNVDAALVWSTVKEDLPLLVERISAVLQSLRGSD